MYRKLYQNTNEFVEAARKVHGDKFSYDLVDYKNLKTPVRIICPVHGEFSQRPADHLKGHGCTECGGTKKLTLDEFIKKAKKVHGKKYNYDNSVYKNIKTPILISCPIHGEFPQLPDEHLRGCGCPQCAGNVRKTKDEFIKESRSVHGNKYDYSSVDYINAKKHVKIICPEHGPFLQTPNKHLAGQGCPVCGFANSLKERGKTSAEELKIYSILKLLFPGTINQHFDKNYPYQCDFYISERKLYIEYNGWWMHGDEWFDPNNDTHNEIISNWKNNSKEQYSAAIATWTVSDVNKRNCAKNNKLNYVVFWRFSDFIEWVNLGCPDGEDWKHEYSWKDPK